MKTEFRVTPIRYLPSNRCSRRCPHFDESDWAVSGPYCNLYKRSLAWYANSVSHTERCKQCLEDFNVVGGISLLLSTETKLSDNEIQKLCNILQDGFDINIREHLHI